MNRQYASDLHSTSGQSEFSDPVYHAIALAQSRHALFPVLPGQASLAPVVVGVSGGPDSVCLLHALRRFASQWKLEVHVAHLDHNLRPESEQDAAFVEQLAATWQLPYHGHRLPPNALADQSGGLESAARRARYTFLLAVAEEVTPSEHALTLVLAHHADDQAETVLMHLIRGSGVEGLGGMRWVSRLEPAFEHPRPPGSNSRAARLVRPLLNVRRNEILRHLAEHHLSWRDDASNRDTTLRRNYVRHTLVPQILEINPNWVETAGRTAQVLAAEAERIRALDRKRLTGLLLDPPACPQPGEPAPERIVLNLAGWQSLELAAQRGTLRQALSLVSPEMDAGFDAVDELVWTLRDRPTSRSVQPLNRATMWTLAGNRLSLHRPDALPFQPDHPFLDERWRHRQGCLAVPVPGRLHGVGGWQLVAEVRRTEELSAAWHSRTTPWHAYLDAHQVLSPVLTVPQPGMTVAPLGMGGKRKSLGDLFTDHKVPAALRSGWPLIVARRRAVVGQRQDDELVWVCGIQIAHPARLTGASTRALCLRWEKES